MKKLICILKNAQKCRAKINWKTINQNKQEKAIKRKRKNVTLEATPCLISTILPISTDYWELIKYTKQTSSNQRSDNFYYSYYSCFSVWLFPAINRLNLIISRNSLLQTFRTSCLSAVWKSCFSGDNFLLSSILLF